VCLPVAVGAVSVGSAVLADGPSKKRPLADFLNTQGSQSIYIPPVPDYWGWTAPPPGVKTPAASYVGGNAGSCDYAGIANKWLLQNGHPGLGTSFSGSLTERSLDDGRILVNLQLSTSNALTFGLRIVEPNFGNFASDPLIFGARAQDVLLGAVPGIGECHAFFVWKQNPGALIDFNHFEGNTSVELVSLSFRANAKGPLTPLAGFGPQGTPGMLIISQSGFFRTTFQGATADGFPAEFVEVRAVGQ